MHALASTTPWLRFVLAIAALWALGATAPQRAQAYTYRLTDMGYPTRWDASRVELKIGPNLQTLIANGDVRAIAMLSAEAWSGYVDVPEIVIGPGTAPAYDPDKRQNGIYAVSPWPFDETRAAVTVSDFKRGGEMTGVDVLFNLDYDFGDLKEQEDDGQTMDLQTVMTHEFGHVLGLDESLDEPKATMWPYIRPGDTFQRSLAEDDEVGVTSLYEIPLQGSSMNTEAACSALPGRKHGGAWPALGLLAALGLSLLRRRRR